MANPWFRLYHDLLDNPKVQRLSPELFRFWVNFLCAAARKGGVIVSIEDLAFALRMSEVDCKCAVSNLVVANLIDRDGEKLIPHDWDKHQYKSDSVNERVKRYREKAAVTKETLHETLHETAPEQIQNRTDTETEQRQKDKTRLSRRHVQRPEGVDQQLWEDFKALRDKQRATITETSLFGIQREAEKAGITLSAALRECCERGWRGFKANWIKPEPLSDPQGRVSNQTLQTMSNLQDYIRG